MHYKLELIVGRDGQPLQASVVVYHDQETVAIATQSVEPFIAWTEVMQELLDGLPVQLRLL